MATPLVAWVIVESNMVTVAPPAVEILTSTPLPVIAVMKHFSMVTLDGIRTRMPLRPVPPPWISIPRSTTVMLAVVVMFMPFVPDDRIPPGRAKQSISSDLVIVTAPKPPGSRQLILPSEAVFEIAPAKVLQGAVRLQGLASSPTPETQVRVACALAGAMLTSPQKFHPKGRSIPPTCS